MAKMSQGGACGFPGRRLVPELHPPPGTGNLGIKGPVFSSETGAC